jgi:hypothetical protein
MPSANGKLCIFESAIISVTIEKYYLNKNVAPVIDHAAGYLILESGLTRHPVDSTNKKSDTQPKLPRYANAAFSHSSIQQLVSNIS